MEGELANFGGDRGGLSVKVDLVGLDGGANRTFSFVTCHLHFGKEKEKDSLDQRKKEIEGLAW